MAIGVKFFRSTDSGAPVVSGTAGTYIALLDACLINGYNSKTITITRSGTTATASSTAHGFVAGQIILVSGANESDYNGEFYITAAEANTFTYTVENSPATPATGTITAKIAPIGGWTKVYSGTNLAAYRADAGNRYYIRVDDTGTSTARIVGYESMSDVNTGVDPFPTVAQLSGGLYVGKSNSVSTAARTWAMFGTNKVFFSGIDFSNNSFNAETYDMVGFGQFESFVGSDSYCTGIWGRPTSSTAQSATYFATSATTSAQYTNTNSYLVRNYNGTVKSAASGKTTDPINGHLATPGYISTTTRYPFYPNKKLYLSEFVITEVATNGVFRGRIKGIWVTNQYVNTNEFRTFDIIDAQVGSSMEGKKFLFLRNYSGVFFLEISDTWSV